MKRGIFIGLLILLITSSQTVEAQLFDKIKNKINKKIEDKVDEKADEILNGKKKGKDKKGTPKIDPKINKKETDDADKTVQVSSSESEVKPELWNKYDFLVADQIFFYDDLKSDEYGEFPAKWNLAFGNAEIARLGDEKVIQFKKADHGSAIYPLIDKKDFIEGYTTIEFDMYINEESYKSIHTSWEFGFHDISNETNVYGGDYVDGDGVERNNHTDGGKIDFKFGNKGFEASMGGKYSGKVGKNKLSSTEGWFHIAMSFNKDSFKFYVNEHKMINIPKVVFNPYKFYIYADPHGDATMTIKNIKLAQGGGSIYKKISTNGRFVTNGILFDSGKSTLQSQSYGVIKKLVDVMTDNPEWKFNIIGHTDSDGDEVSNLKLSKERAEAVKIVLTEKGIDAKRLTTDGKGESTPLSPNTSPLNKANNRRVEFIKQ